MPTKLVTDLQTGEQKLQHYVEGYNPFTGKQEHYHHEAYSPFHIMHRMELSLRYLIARCEHMLNDGELNEVAREHLEHHLDIARKAFLQDGPAPERFTVKRDRPPPFAGQKDSV